MSVRKRVIKILKDICLECPDFKKIPEICVKMIRRINDEEGIKKLVQEVFQVSNELVVVLFYPISDYVVCYTKLLSNTLNYIGCFSSLLLFSGYIF